MYSHFHARFIALGFALLMATAAPAQVTQQQPAVASVSAPTVRIMRLPAGGVQPEIVSDGAGNVHVVYFTGDAKAGNLMYMKSSDGGATFSTPIRVNSIDSSALAVGSVRGSQLALGRGGRIHVVWNASGAVTMRDPQDKSRSETPLLYTRLSDDGSAFEPERNIIGSHFGLDGGAAVAADRNGRVYVAWHAPANANSHGEQDRRVWMAASTDDGTTFGAEKAIDVQSRGCCACCGLTAFCSPGERGDVHVLYRTAEQVVHRDMHLLISRDGGATFSQTAVDPWEAGQCVMSTAAFVADESKSSGVWAAWETRGTARLARLPASDDDAAKALAIIKPAGQGDNAKHPVLAVNDRGEMLMAWTEGTAWARGGSVAWQIYDRNGKVMLEKPGRSADLPVWGLVAAFEAPEGGFVIVY